MKYSLSIPEKLFGRYLEAYKEIGEQLISDPSIQSAFLSNSLLVSSPDDNSDLDIIAITNENVWQRKQLSVGGVFVELFLYSREELFKSFEAGDYQDMHMVAYGFVMFDKSKQASEIKENAKEIFERGPGIPTLEKIDYLKYLVWDSYCDVSDIILKDPVGSVALMHKSVWFSIEASFSLKGRWFCKPKRLLAAVADLDSDLHLLLDRFYKISNTNIEDLFQIYSEIIEKVIFPHHLKEHFVWTSDKHNGSYELL